MTEITDYNRKAGGMYSEIHVYLSWHGGSHERYAMGMGDAGFFAAYQMANGTPADIKLNY